MQHYSEEPEIYNQTEAELRGCIKSQYNTNNKSQNTHLDLEIGIGSLKTKQVIADTLRYTDHDPFVYSDMLTLLGLW